MGQYFCFHHHRFWGLFHSWYQNLGQVPPPPPPTGFVPIFNLQRNDLVSKLGYPKQIVCLVFFKCLFFIKSDERSFVYPFPVPSFPTPLPAPSVYASSFLHPLYPNPLCTLPPLGEYLCPSMCHLATPGCLPNLKDQFKTFF